MKIRKMLAVCIAKLVCNISRRLGKQGVTWAGKIALALYPDIIKDLSGQVKEKIFVTCGTNGKTTTNNLLCSALEYDGKRVICNHTGSNMLNGVAAAFVLSADWHGNIDADFACIEVDEASTKQVFPQLNPDYMLLTNLFRDQLDRYGEIDITMQILDTMIQSVPKLRLIVNADDALSYYLIMKSKHSFITYGIEEKATDNDNSNEIREGKFCKVCGEKLRYNFYHYSQLGDYYCPGCSFKRPVINYNARNIVCENYISFEVENKTLTTNYRGFYNIYNILCAYAALRTTGSKAENFQKMLDNFNPENGRMESFFINGTEIILNLAKNPAGFNQNVTSVMQDTRKKDLIVVINDNDQDGTDVSWLWDVDFDKFASDSINSVTVSGIRGRDMLLRFKYDDISAELCDSVKSAIENRIADGCKNLYVLVNYTALFSTENILRKLQEGCR